MAKETVQTGGNFSFHPKADPDKYHSDPVKKKFESAYNKWQDEKKQRKVFRKKFVITASVIIAIILVIVLT
jgi:hypothetical protein